MKGRAPGFVLAVLLLGCGGEQALTQIVVVVDSDWEEIQRVRIEFEGFGDGETAEAALDDKAFPRTLGLVHEEGPLGPIGVTVSAFLANRTEPALVEPRTDIYFEPGRTRMLWVELLRRCEGVCEEQQACVEDGEDVACVPSDMAASLEPWTGEATSLPPDLSISSGGAGAGPSRDAEVADAGNDAMTGGTDAGNDAMTGGADAGGDAGGRVGVDAGMPPSTGCTSSVYMGRVYWFCTEEVDWSEARANCMAVARDLARIDNAEEDAFAHSLLGSFSGQVWLGAQDTDQEGEWRWVDNGDQFWNGDENGNSTDASGNGPCDPASDSGCLYSDWYDGSAGSVAQPNDAASGSLFSADCLGYSTDFDAWMDAACDSSGAYICK